MIWSQVRQAPLSSEIPGSSSTGVPPPVPPPPPPTRLPPAYLPWNVPQVDSLSAHVDKIYSDNLKIS